MHNKLALKNPTIRLALIVGLAAILIIITVQYLHESQIKKTVDDIIYVKSGQAEIISTVISQKISDAIKIIELTSKEEVVRQIDSPNLIDENLHGVPQNYETGKRQLASNILGSYKNFVAIRFTLPNGDMYMMEPYENQLNLKTTNFAFRDWFKNGIYANTPYVSEVYVAQSVDRRSLSITAPVYSSNGNIIGLWGGVLDLNFLVDMINGYQLGKNTRVILIDHNSNEVIDTQNPNFSEINSFSYLDSAKKALSESDGTSVETINGKKVFVVYHPVKAGTHTWALLLLQPYEDAFSDADKQRLESFVVNGLVITIASLCIAILCFRRQSTKIPHKEPKEPPEYFWYKGKDKLEGDIEIGHGQQRSVLSSLLESDHHVRRSSVNRYALLLITAAIVFSTAFIMYQSHPPALLNTMEKPSLILPQTKYVIENLRGDVVNTWISWNLVKDRALAVNVVAGPSIPKEKISIVKDAILSKVSIELDDSLLGKGPPGTQSTYYKGWTGAVAKVSKSTTKFYVPGKFDVISSPKGEGDITITLTNLKDPDGLAGYTKAVVENHQILKAMITIYGITDLSNKQLEAVARHEFGHALGLAHSTAPEDLMHDVVTTDYPYISDCDIDALVAVYNGKHSSEVVCEK